MDRMDRGANPVELAALVRKDHRDNPAHLASKDHRDCPARMDVLVPMVKFSL